MWQQARTVVAVRRFHTQPMSLTQPAAWVDGVKLQKTPPDAPGGTYSESGYEDLQGRARRGGEAARAAAAAAAASTGDGASGASPVPAAGLDGDGDGDSVDRSSVGRFPGYDEDDYFAVYAQMIEASNVDGEMAVLNQLHYDLLTAVRVDQWARSYGLTEVRHLMRKFWPAWLQTGGSKGHFHVIHHFVRQLFGLR